MDEKLRAKWPTRIEGNRLEPECWPLIRPGFTLDPAQPVFTIGSCFARNVERRLEANGFDIPAINFIRDHPEIAEGQGTEVLNKYTPPSIYQELAWTRAILDRDDTVRPEDLEPLLYELPTGKFVDLQRRTFQPGGYNHEDALAFRRLFYSLFKRAFECSSIVITLGLIECWWDNQNEAYVEFNPSIQTKRNRFSFRVLDYVESFDYVQKSVDLLNRDRTPNILLTTSPVPLNRTFSGDDVIVANMYSKSVLRSVAGAIVKKNENVEYFPSYESVMLTKRADIWKDDLVHIEDSFVDQIMAQVLKVYVPSDAVNTEDDPRFRRFVMLVAEKKWDEAADLYPGIEDQDPGQVIEFHLRCAELELHKNNSDKAADLLDKAASIDNPQRSAEHYYFKCARLLRGLGRSARVEECRLKAMDRCKNDLKRFRGLLTSLLKHRNKDDVWWLLEYAETKFGDDPDFALWLAVSYDRLERDADVHRVCQRMMSSGRADAGLHFHYARFLFRKGDAEAAIANAEKALAMGGEDERLMKRLSGHYMRSRDHEKAFEILPRLCELQPDDAQNHLFLARCYLYRHEWDKVGLACERVESLSPGHPAVVKLLELASERSTSPDEDSSDTPVHASDRAPSAFEAKPDNVPTGSVERQTGLASRARPSDGKGPSVSLRKTTNWLGRKLLFRR